MEIYNSMLKKEGRCSERFIGTCMYAVGPRENGAVRLQLVDFRVNIVCRVLLFRNYHPESCFPGCPRGRSEREIRAQKMQLPQTAGEIQREHGVAHAKGNSRFQKESRRNSTKGPAESPRAYFVRVFWQPRSIYVLLNTVILILFLHLFCVVQ